MSDIKIVPVTTKKGLRAFIQFYYDLYKGNRFAVPFPCGLTNGTR